MNTINISNTDNTSSEDINQTNKPVMYPGQHNFNQNLFMPPDASMHLQYIQQMQYMQVMHMQHMQNMQNIPNIPNIPNISNITNMQNIPNIQPYQIPPMLVNSNPQYNSEEISQKLNKLDENNKILVEMIKSVLEENKALSDKLEILNSKSNIKNTVTLTIKEEPRPILVKEETHAITEEVPKDIIKEEKIDSSNKKKIPWNKVIKITPNEGKEEKTSETIVSPVNSETKITKVIKDVIEQEKMKKTIERVTRESQEYFQNLIDIIDLKINELENSAFYYLPISKDIQKIKDWHVRQYGAPLSHTDHTNRSNAIYSTNNIIRAFIRAQEYAYDLGYTLVDISDPSIGEKTLMVILRKNDSQKMDQEYKKLWHGLNKLPKHLLKEDKSKVDDNEGEIDLNNIPFDEKPIPGMSAHQIFLRDPAGNRVELNFEG